MKITEKARIFWLLFSIVKTYTLTLTKIVWTIFWAIFLQTHLVTLVWKLLQEFLEETVERFFFAEFFSIRLLFVRHNVRQRQQRQEVVATFPYRTWRYVEQLISLKNQFLPFFRFCVLLPSIS
jgi:hypothetical protein